MGATKNAAETSDWLNNTRENLQKRRTASDDRFGTIAIAMPQALSEDSFASVSGSASPALPDAARQQLRGVTEILAGLGIGKINTVQAIRLDHGAAKSPEAAALTHNS